MRAVYVIPLSVLLVVLGLVFTFSGMPVFPSPSVAMPLPSAQDDPLAADASAGLACIQSALGGERAFADVSSFRIRADTKPAASTGYRPLPGTREIIVVLPDRYKRVEQGLLPGPATGRLSSIVGFDGRVILNRPRGRNDEHSMSTARADFERQMLMRLPRESAGVRLSQRVLRESGQERLAIDASGADGFRATLLADGNTCVPVALRFDRADLITERVDLSEYREFGGIRFPTVLITSRGGEPFAEEYVSDVELNAPGADEYFAPGR